MTTWSLPNIFIISNISVTHAGAGLVTKEQSLRESDGERVDIFVLLRFIPL